MSLQTQHMPNKARLEKAQAAFSAGRFTRARELCEKLLSHEDVFTDARLLMLKIHTAQGKPERGLRFARELAETFPQNAGVQLLAGDTAKASGEAVAAMGFFHAALLLKPDDANVWLKLIGAMVEAGAKEEAVALSGQAAATFPQNQALWHQRGKLLSEQEEHEEALDAFLRALSLNEGDKELQDAFVEKAHELEKWDLLIEYADSLGEGLRSLSLMARSNISEAFRDRLLLDRTRQIVEDIAADYPGHPVSNMLIATLAFSEGRYVDVISHCDKVLQSHEGNAVVRWNRALACYYLGRFEEYYEEMDTRFDCKSGSQQRANLQGPQWEGEDISHKTLLIWSDHGLGDIFQLMPLMEEASKCAGRTIIEAQAKVVPLLRRWLPGVAVRAKPKTLPNFIKINISTDYDVHVPLGNLQKIFLPEPQSIKTMRRSYCALEDRVQDLMRHPLLADRSRPKVGLCWRSGKWRETWSRFSPPLEVIEQGLSGKEVDYICLQYTKDAAEEIAAVREKTGFDVKFIEGLDLFDDIEGVLALCACLDGVISSGSTVGDMSGILGVKTFRYGRPGPGMTFGGSEFPWFYNQQYTSLYPESKMAELTAAMSRWLEEEVIAPHRSAVEGT